MSVSVVIPTCMYVYRVHAWGRRKPEEDVALSGTGVTVGYKLPYYN